MDLECGAAGLDGEAGSLYISMPDGRIVALSGPAVDMITEMGEAVLEPESRQETAAVTIAEQEDTAGKAVKDSVLASGATVETLLLTTASLDGETLDCAEVDFTQMVEEITSYKCRVCSFLSDSKGVLLSHVQTEHGSGKAVAVETEVEEAVTEVEVGPDQNIAGLSIILDTELDQSEPGSRLETGGKTGAESGRVSRKVVDPQLGTHYQVLVQGGDREMLVCGQCSDCFDSQEELLAHQSQLACFTPVCPHCNVDFGGSVSGRLGFLQHVQSCSGQHSADKILSVLNDPNDKKNVIIDIVTEAEVSLETVVPAKQADNRELERDAHTRVLSCPVKSCSFLFKHVDQLKYHQSCHTEGAGRNQNFSCVECSLPFEKWRELATHLWRAHAIDCDMLLCGYCSNYRTMYPKIMESHNQTHENLKKFQCDICKKRFNQMSQLKNHSVIHIKNKSIAEIPCWAKPKNCDICKKTFSDSKSLKKHVQAIHSKLKPYICQVCGHQSARKAMLQLHVRQHTGEKPFECEDCDYRTGDHNSLRRHRRRHTGDKPYKCPYCPYAAIQSQSFKSHLKSKHPERPAVDLKGGHADSGVTTTDTEVQLGEFVLVGLQPDNKKLLAGAVITEEEPV